LKPRSVRLLRCTPVDSTSRPRFHP
jgi:hypothetical protein